MSKQNSQIDKACRKNKSLQCSVNVLTPFISGLPAQLPVPPPVPVGTSLERFILLNHLGQGTFGTVYRAYDRLRQQDVAVKVIAAESDEDMEKARQLFRELPVQDPLHDYRHVLRLYDLHCQRYQEKDYLLLSMELADGGSLEHWLRASRLSLPDRWAVGFYLFRQMCQGIRALHQVGMVHGDISLRNFLLVQGIVKVSDFGLVQLQGDEQSNPELQGPARRILGDPFYASPEHFTCLNRADLTVQSDIYSLAVACYRLCHPQKRFPFQGSVDELARLHQTQEIPIIERLPSFLQEILCRCLEKDPSKRFETVDELLSRLPSKCTRPRFPGKFQRKVLLEPVELDGLWDECQRKMGDDHLLEAMSLCRKILGYSPGHQPAQELLEHLEERYRQAETLCKAIDREMAQMGLYRPKELIQEAKKLFGDHPQLCCLEATFTDRVQKYQEYFVKGKKALQEQRWKLAGDALTQAYKINPLAEELCPLIDLLSPYLRLLEEIERGYGEASKHNDCVKRYFVQQEEAKLKNRLQEELPKALPIRSFLLLEAPKE
jgi:serine/threonine protein kinase